jgi:hypothetical protein
MKNLIVIIALIAGGYFIATKTGMINSEPHPSIAVYKKFMDRYIVRQYEDALNYATGSAAEQIESDMDKTSMTFMNREIKTPLADGGRVEGSRMAVTEEIIEDSSAHLTIKYSASISWLGMTANPMSPKSWRNWDQTAVLVEENGQWKVESFSSN